jgi:Cu-Zn family superoxide dismutase
MMTALAGATVLIAVPTAATADRVLVDHGHGPTFVHDPAYAGAKTQVHSWARDGGTDVRLRVSGLAAGRTYGAHVHVGRCGADPLASGGHYQHEPGTGGALEAHEVWLDLTTDEHGRGVGAAHVPWLIEAGTAGSVVIHAAPTNPTTGAAGARLVCTDVPFGE